MATIPGRPHRLVPSRYPPIPAFDEVTAPDDLAAVMELEGWTNDRLIPQRLARLPRDQWVYGRPNSSVVMAAFLRPANGGSRFNGPELGAWYAADTLKGAIAEIAHHVRRELHNSGKPVEVLEYREYTAALAGDYENIRGQQAARPELYHPADYAASQAFGEVLRASGRTGVVYESLRLVGANNTACYRPPDIQDVTMGRHFRLTVSVDRGPQAVVLLKNGSD